MQGQGLVRREARCAMSRLVEFYRGAATDTEGRRLEEVWGWDDDSLEAVHDFIQWLFPLPEPSNFNPDAPLLTAADVAAFRADALLRSRLRRSFERFLSFLGLTIDEGGRVAEGPNFVARVRDAWAYPNHNWLRVSRVLRSLTLLGLEAEARALYDWLSAAYQGRRFPIPTDTFGYWSAAVGDAPRG
jgi:hypothetical protein